MSGGQTVSALIIPYAEMDSQPDDYVDLDALEDHNVCISEERLYDHKPVSGKRLPCMRCSAYDRMESGVRIRTK